MNGPDRAALVIAASETIAKGSQSFAAASRIFDTTTRERAWLLYAWCRAADDMTDGQELGHGAAASRDPVATQAELERLTRTALTSNEAVPMAFAGLREVARETGMPATFIRDHIAGFALDAEGWRPQNTHDLLRYCYHVAGSVGCMMAVVMGVNPDDQDTLDRACDLGLAFQLANIARDLVTDAEVARCYVPSEWLCEAGLTEISMVVPESRLALAAIAERLVRLARLYRVSARVGASRLPYRSRLAVLAADAIYGAIGEKVVRLGERAWESRVSTGKAEKLALFAGAAMRAGMSSGHSSREGLWNRGHVQP